MNYFNNNYAFKVKTNINLEILSFEGSFPTSHKEIIGSLFNNHLTDKSQRLSIDCNTPKTIEILGSNGNLHYYEAILVEEDGAHLIYGIDVTQATKAKVRLSQIGHYANVGYWERFQDGTLTWTDAIYEIFDLDAETTDPLNIEEIAGCFSPETGKLLESNMKRIWSEGGGYDLEIEILTKKNNKKWLRTTGIAIEYQGKIVRIEGITQDVTSYRENVVKLFESQQSLRFVMSANGMGSWKVDLKTGAMSWDHNMCAIFGIDLAKAPRNSDDFFALIHPDDVIRIKNEHQIALVNKEAVTSSWFRVNVNDEIRYIASRSEYSETENGFFLFGLNWDITKEKKAEELIRIQEAKIISSARLSSLGEMAGSIAHEINNPLSVIFARATQLKRRILKNDFTATTVVEGLTQIEKTCNRILKIITGLRTISRDGDKDPFDNFTLQHCISEITTLVSERFKNNNIEFNVLTPEKAVWVRGRFVQIEQVLMNVLNNAYDAVCSFDERSITIELLQRDSFAEIRIWDSGHGVIESLRDKIFQPFFTTKDIGRGTGIGLSISRSIIADHGGEFNYINEENVWYFQIILPLKS